jgi:hypothetical protein
LPSDVVDFDEEKAEKEAMLRGQFESLYVAIYYSIA